MFQIKEPCLDLVSKKCVMKRGVMANGKEVYAMKVVLFEGVGTSRP